MKIQNQNQNQNPNFTILNPTKKKKKKKLESEDRTISCCCGFKSPSAMITVIELNKQIDTLNQRNYQTNCVFVIEQDCVRLFVC